MGALHDHGDVEHAGERRAWLWLLILSAVLACLAYGGVLDNYFYEIDDAKTLDGIGEGIYAGAPRFLPVHFAWLRLLHGIFGVHPAGYYASSLLLHALSATAIGVFVHRLTRQLPIALVSVAGFAVLYAPHETVLWITANCGLLSMLFVLLSTLAWDDFLTRGRRRSYVLAIAWAILAMGSKEDAVLLAPMLLGLDRIRNGTHWREGFVRRYALFAALGLVFLVVSLRPDHWPGAHLGGLYTWRQELLPKLVSNYAILFWPRHLGIGQSVAWALPAGLLILLVLGAASWIYRKTIPLIPYGLLVSLCGLLPVLPGPDRIIAQQRFAYPGAVGVGLLAAGFAQAFEKAARRLAPVRRRSAHVSGLLLVLAGTTVGILAIRSSEQWQFERKCSRFSDAMSSTGTAWLAARAATLPLEQVHVLAPVIWDPFDYARGLHAFLGLPKDRIELRFLPVEEVLRTIGRDGWLSSPTTGVYVGNQDGSISRARRIEDLPLPEWERVAPEFAARDLGRTIPVVTLKPLEGTVLDRVPR